MNTVDSLFTSGNLSISTVCINLICGALLSFLLGWHFRRFGSSFSNRAKFSSVLPPIALTTVLVISVVKASLALSLGLVGALSIVRFRTPVKEPEELAYLFMAIAIGLGMGADHRFITTTAILLILVVLTVRSLLYKGSRHPNLYLNVEVPHNNANDDLLNRLLTMLSKTVNRVDLRRFDVHDKTLQATFYLDCKDPDILITVQKEILKEFPDSSIMFVEQSSLPGG